MAIILKAQDDVLQGLTKVLNQHHLELDEALHFSGKESYKEGIKAFENYKIICLMLFFQLRAGNWYFTQRIRCWG